MSETTTPTRPAQAGLAITALVVGIVAFFGGWIPLIGLLLGIAGVITGIVALRRRQSRGFSLTGIVLSAVAIITNIIVTIIVIVALVTGGLAAFITGAAQASDPDALGTQPIETPCYSFDGPAGYIDNIDSDAVAACNSELQLWGEQNADGTIDNTGVGAIWGSVNVEAVDVVTGEDISIDGTLDTLIDELNRDFIPSFGEVISLREPVTLDGAEANITRVTSEAATTETKALIVGFSPEIYPTAADDVNLFVISVVIPDGSGDAVIAALVDSWRWK